MTAYNYTYDNNGNMTSDQLNRTGSIKYDHRNLMTEIRVIKPKPNPDPFGPPTIDVLYLTKYRYDEAGNRIRKTRWEYTGSDPDPVFDISGDAPPWTLQSDEFYVRDVSGKEIAIYSGSSLTQWNIWGLDNPPGGGQVVGKINSDTTRNYYLKDHLGSIRVVLNSTNTVISAQDYDAWGYLLENRTYNSSAMRYDFTGKERDDETSYDYFGARYYDSRIANWTSIDPLFEKHIHWTPYNYVLRNPLRFIDPDGMQIQIIAGLAAAAEALVITGAVVGSAYLAADYLSDKYVEYQSAQLQADLTQESVQITSDPSITNPNMETRNKDVKKGIEGAIGQIVKHLDKISGANPNSGDPNKWKDKWKKDIEKQIKNIRKAAGKLKKDPQKVIEELIEKGKLNQERIIKAGEELKKIGIDFLK